MYNIIFQQVDSIIEISSRVLNTDAAHLAEKQVDFLQKIVTNAVYLKEICADFQAISENNNFSWDEMAKVRHELSNPITPILAYSELMLIGKVGTLCPEHHEDMQAIFLSACVIRECIEEIKIESRRLQAANSA